MECQLLGLHRMIEIDSDVTIKFTIFIEHDNSQSVVHVFGCLKIYSTALKLVEIPFHNSKKRDMPLI